MILASPASVEPQTTMDQNVSAFLQEAASSSALLGDLLTAVELEHGQVGTLPYRYRIRIDLKLWSKTYCVRHPYLIELEAELPDLINKLQSPAARRCSLFNPTTNL